MTEPVPSETLTTDKKVGQRWLVRIGEGPIMEMVIEAMYRKTVELRLGGSYSRGFHLWDDVEFIERIK